MWGPRLQFDIRFWRLPQVVAMALEEGCSNKFLLFTLTLLPLWCKSPVCGNFLPFATKTRVMQMIYLGRSEPHRHYPGLVGLKKVTRNRH